MAEQFSESPRMKTNHQDQGGTPFETKAKLFVGNLSNMTTESMLKSQFSKYGEVKEALIIFDRVSGNSRGFGFVTFGDSSMANQALQAQNFIHGRKVDVKPAIPKRERMINQQQNEDSNNEIRTKKIFVGGLPSKLTENEFKDCFGEFGRIIDAVVMRDKITGESRKFGFITFESEDSADNVLKNRYCKLKGEFVEVKRAIPKKNYPDQLNFDFEGYPCYYCNTNIYSGFWDGGYYNYHYPSVGFGNYYWYNSEGLMSSGSYMNGFVENSTAADIDASEDEEYL